MPRYRNEPDAIIDLQMFRKGLEEGPYWPHPLMHKSYITVLFYVGCRRSEPLPPVVRRRKHPYVRKHPRKKPKVEPGVKKEDVQIKGEILLIHVPALKGGERNKPNKLPLRWPFINLIKERWEKTKNYRYLWPFTPETAYNIVTKNWPRISPHWFRHNRITLLRRLRDQRKVTTDDIRSWTGIQSDKTLSTYGMRTEEGIDNVAKAIDEEMA